MCSSSAVRTPKWQLTAEQWLTEYWVPPKKIYPTSKGIEEAPERLYEGKITFTTKLYTCQRHSKGSNKTVYASEPRDTTETGQTCLWVFESRAEVWVSSSQQQRQGLWGSYLSHTAHGIGPLGGGHHQPHHRAAEQNPQTSKQLYQINSCTVKKVLGCKKDFPTWRSGKGTENL